MSHSPVDRRRIAPLAFALVHLSIAAGAQTPRGERLNVLFIMSDDLRPELGAYGSRLGAQTPNIDALASAGVRFDRAYAQFALCNPSRASLLTGRHPLRTGILGNRGFFRDFHPEIVSLPQHFKDGGYSTLRAGKIFHGGIDDTEAWTEGGEPRGPNANIANLNAPSNTQDRSGPQAARDRASASDRIVVLKGEGETDGDFNVAERTIALLRKYKDRPFFMATGFSKPHSPPAAPKRFFDLYKTSSITLPPDFAARPTVPPGFPRMAIRPRNADLFIDRDAASEEAKEVTRAYLASISWMDSNVGRVIAELDRLKLREKTVIVFLGDHGYHLGEKGKWSKAGSLFEAGTRVPLIMVMPGAAGNGRPSSRVVQAIDVYPTLVEVCGLKAPLGVDGRSLASLLKEPAAAWDHPAFSLWSEDGRTVHGASVRTERFRYAEYGGGSGGAMLLDPQADPHEMRNLADDPAQKAVRNELSALVKAYLLDKGSK
jgi:iduronate 2-sulfatase